MKITFLKNKFNQKKKTKMREKIIGNFEIFILLVSIIAFAYFISDLPSVEASSLYPTGCCLEDKQGGICQNMLMVDAGLCKTGLIATDCYLTDECKVGCCYNPNEGSCSLNSPKAKCIENGGNWSDSTTCNIPECALGCCIIGEEAAIKTNRECTLLSRELNFEKNFQPIDSEMTCNSYTGASKKGACVTDTGDGSGEKDCIFTNKGSCTTDFYEGYLCTAPDLHTICEKTSETMCVEGRDEVYYKDSCGNQANIYDSSKIDDDEYWTKVISTSNSCKGSNKDCGNCDYLSGSRCYEYRQGRDSKPTYGDYVCRDLSCDNGKQHGESWCLYDYDVSTPAAAPVGSRHFVGSCVEGEISYTACADFAQEVCIEAGGSGFSEATCFPNLWRNCLVANNGDTYAEVEEECNKYDDCIMFLDIPGNEDKYTWDGDALPGFKRDVPNAEQGNAGKVGKDSNEVIAHCVPKYTPGLQFWTSTIDQADYGGSEIEANSICGLGTFTCVSHKECKPANNCDWKDKDGLTWTCNYQNEKSFEIKTEALELLLDGLNERCRAVGSCGSYVNIERKLGGEGYTIERVYIDEDGDAHENYESEHYNLSSTYLDSLKEKPGIGAIHLDGDSLTISETTDKLPHIPGTALQLAFQGAQKEVGEAGQESIERGRTNLLIGNALIGLASWAGFVPLTGAGLKTSAAAGGWVAKGATTTVAKATLGSWAGATVGALSWAMVGAYIGYELGVLIAKNSGMSPGETTAFVYAMAALGGAAGAALFATYAAIAAEAGCATVVGCVVGLIIAIILLIIAGILYFTTGEDNRYYVMTFECEAWEPPDEGNCGICNNDLLSCSEYRCRSLGKNCKYYTDLGEPGWCAESKDIWSAKISPWNEILTEGHKYTNIASNHFKIEQKEKEELEPWVPITFGIETDKPATCKLDIKHTENYDSMSYTLEKGDEFGTKHKITLSPHVGNSSNSATAGMVEGENNYYIRCMNFAGQVNEAEFAVKLNLGSGPDLTAPTILEFNPKSGSYVKYGANSTEIRLYVNEPSECKYSKDDDLDYGVMPGVMQCITDPNVGYMGKWPCYATLSDLNLGENKFYIKCKDQPDLEETTILKRNLNQLSKEYVVNLCSVGLEITDLGPDEKTIGGKSPVETLLTAETSGCVENGKSICSYRFESSNYTSNQFVKFYDTDSTTHSQIFSTIIPGIYNVTVVCIDEAENIAEDSIKFDVFVDDNNPKVLRTYVLNQKLKVVTDEKSECVYHQDNNVQCEFDFEDGKLMTTDAKGLEHDAEWQINKDYYIQCRDMYNNTKGGCDIVVRTY